MKFVLLAVHKITTLYKNSVPFNDLYNFNFQYTETILGVPPGPGLYLYYQYEDVNCGKRYLSSIFPQKHYDKK